ncbi:hypothetical protein [Nocardioides sp. GXZ039]|uniref:hypothetical protein n=1 Tax=Nocardioides sp. GXZ039 TaxID=3136018 RepID=UPI0030F4AF03
MIRQFSVSLTAGVFAVGALAAPWSAAAPSPGPATTCGGETATLVGSAGDDTLTGTPGRDVIVTNGSHTVDAGDGDDLVCITGATREVLAGPGDDDVRGQQTRGDADDVSIWLDSGSDTFVGGELAEYVGADPTLGETDEPDVIRTGGGPDGVSAGISGTPLVDVISLGAGNDEVDLDSRVASSSFQLSGGAGADQLAWSQGIRDGWGAVGWTIDNRSARGTAATGGTGRSERMAWTSFERFRLDARVGWTDFLGGDRGEWLDARRLRSVDLGGGNDLLAPSWHFDDARFTGGSGRDSFKFMACRGNATLNLAAGTYVCTNPDDEASLGGFEEAVTTGRDVRMQGTDGADRLVAHPSCDATVRAGGGDDVVRVHGPVRNCGSATPPAGAQVFGGAGDDTIAGWRRSDLLIGGSGTDLANGRGGDDRCVAERRVNCES